MKVGILTYHRAHNYGAFMQAFALKKYIESLGHEVIFVDYENKNHHSLYKLWGRVHSGNNKKATFHRIKEFVKQLLTFRLRFIRYHKFEREIHAKLGITSKLPIFNPNNLKDNCDIYVYGSDQIWRKDSFVGGFDSVYWGSYPKTISKKITYAASMGKIVSFEENEKYIEHKLNNFYSVSVREIQLKNMLKSLSIQKEVTLVCDPTLLLNKELWINEFSLVKKKTTKNILFYHLLKSRFTEDFVKSLVKNNEYKLFELTGSVDLFRYKNSYRQTAGPKEFLEFIYNSNLVISTSFHGVIFALIFEKDFYAMGMDDNNTRVLTLLEKIGLSNRYINEGGSIPENLDHVDYNSVRDKLSSYVLDSKKYLKDNLKE